MYPTGYTRLPYSPIPAKDKELYPGLPGDYTRIMPYPQTTAGKEDHGEGRIDCESHSLKSAFKENSTVEKALLYFLSLFYHHSTGDSLDTAVYLQGKSRSLAF